MISVTYWVRVRVRFKVRVTIWVRDRFGLLVNFRKELELEKLERRFCIYPNLVYLYTYCHQQHAASSICTSHYIHATNSSASVCCPTQTLQSEHLLSNSSTPEEKKLEEIWSET